MISSRQNPKVLLVRALLSKPRQRREAQAFVVEGVRLVEEAVNAGWEPRLVLYSEGLSERGRVLLSRLTETGAEVEQVTPEIMRSISDTEAPQGILTVINQRVLPIPPRLDFVLIVDEVRDPGNLGTLLRSAAAAGVQAVFIPPGTVDPFSSKVIRAAMGAHFHLPIL
ncbi:MAG: RNA methyltransferase, partial [Chloroflexi bacterium]|nr:RNA methyltransferase [Chloroflexota bacterium]